jgi:hypothetical protein
MDISQITLPRKRKLWAAVAFLAAAFGASSATLPIYVNNAPFISPPQQTNIDAQAWFNRAYFSVATLTGLPFESLNTRFFTNVTASVGLYPAGTMIVDPGLRFFRNSNGQRFWMDNWENNGTISTDHNSFFLFGGLNLFFSDSRASILQVAATNITSTGPLFSGAHGLIRLEGQRINLSRTSLRTGNTALSSGILGGGFLGLSNYVNDIGIADLYWGEGDGDHLAAANSTTMRLDGQALRPVFSLPFPSSTFHEVITLSTFGSFPLTNSTVVPGGSFFFGTNFFSSGGLTGYGAVAYTNSLSPTSRVVQVVFFPTNTADSNFVTDVRFYDPSGGFGFANPAIAVVGFHSTDFDITTQTTGTDSVYLSDALATTTNVFLARNQSANTRRPSSYELTRSVPIGYFSGVPGNTAYDTNLLYNSTFTRTSVTNRYAGYAAQVDLLSSSPNGSIPYDVTNVPGRIEILGDEVNLEQTRIRAESAVIIKANNLTSNQLAMVDAPLINFDARSFQPTFIISNLAPQSVRRLSGIVRAWSAAWENFEGVPAGAGFVTNSVSFHVMIVESQLRSQVPVTVNEFAARGTNVVINDLLNIRKSFVVEGNSFHLTGGLNLPFGVNLASNTMINVRNFTNDGVINILGSEYFGTDRALSYSNYINRGTNIASSHEIRTRNFENPGCIVANGGLFSLDALTATLVGNPLITSNYVSTNLVFLFPSGLTNVVTTNITVLQGAPKIEGASDVQIFVRDLTVSNSIINASRLIMSVTNRLADSGVGATNFWSVTGGFNLMRRPTTSDLLGTYLRSTTPRLGQASHYWSATNLGAVSAGFTNNLALGKLILDGGDGSLFRFFGQGTNNALYVDYIELLNAATNFNSLLAIAPNLTIYFANANVPAERLDGAAGGRLRWVPTYAGPLSSTNITYFVTNGVGVVTSNTYTFNIALVTSQNLDSDGDGIANVDDPEPILVAGSAGLSISLAAAPERRVELSWRALSYSSNFLEFKASAGPTDWQVLTNFQMGPLTWPVTVIDPIATNGASRVYRLRVHPAPF